MNPYGSTTFKQVFIYGGLNSQEPLTFTPSWFSAGFNWSVGGFYLGNVLGRVGPARTKELFQRVGSEINTTFATHYKREISFEQALDPKVMRQYAAQATGSKFLLNPNK